MNNHLQALCVIIATGLILTTQARATQIIRNGDFESGTLEGWSHFRVGGANIGGFFADNDGTAPVSGQSTVGAASGSYYAVADQTGPGASVLLQTFSIEAGYTAITLSFAIFVNNHSNLVAINPAGLVWNTAEPNQHVRVDLLRFGSDPFSTHPNDVLTTFYRGAPFGSNPQNYTTYSFDLRALSAGGTFHLRFAEVSNQGYFTVGVDDVRIDADRIAVPEPRAIALVSCGLLLAGCRRFTARRRLRG